MNFYTADLHFGCESVFDRENRKEIFGDINTMNETLVKNINEVCAKDDVLYILGDVACAEYNPKKELSQIKAKKVLIAGNHDAKWLSHKSFTEQFEKILEIGHVRTCGTRITLFHYPMCEWDGMMKGHWHFYGHVHKSNMGSGRLMEQIPNCCNVGVDVNGYRPVSATELIATKMKNDAMKKIDYSAYKEIMGDVYSYVDVAEEDQRGKCILDYLAE